MSAEELSVDELWSETEPGREVFRPEAFLNLVEPARRYLEHAIVPGTISRAPWMKSRSARLGG